MRVSADGISPSLEVDPTQPIQGERVCVGLTRPSVTPSQSLPAWYTPVPATGAINHAPERTSCLRTVTQIRSWIPLPFPGSRRPDALAGPGAQDRHGHQLRGGLSRSCGRPLRRLATHGHPRGRGHHRRRQGDPFPLAGLSGSAGPRCPSELVSSCMISSGGWRRAGSGSARRSYCLALAGTLALTRLSERPF